MRATNWRILVCNPLQRTTSRVAFIVISSDFVFFLFFCAFFMFKLVFSTFPISARFFIRFGEKENSFFFKKRHDIASTGGTSRASCLRERHSCLCKMPLSCLRERYHRASTRGTIVPPQEARVPQKQEKRKSTRARHLAR